MLSKSNKKSNGQSNQMFPERKNSGNVNTRSNEIVEIVCYYT